MGAGSRPSGRRGDQHGLDRVMAFADAVAAIAITLVALPVVDRAMDAGSAREFLADGWQDLGPALISFLVIAAFWRAHHWLFAPATGYSSRVLTLEMLWLGTIVALPVATVLDFAAEGGDRLALGVYIGTMLLSSLALDSEAVVLEREGFVEPSPEARGYRRWVGSALFAVALVLAVAFPGGGALWLLVLLLVGPVLAVSERREARRAGRDDLRRGEPGADATR